LECAGLDGALAVSEPGAVATGFAVSILAGRYCFRFRTAFLIRYRRRADLFLNVLSIARSRASKTAFAVRSMAISVRCRLICRCCSSLRVWCC